MSKETNQFNLSLEGYEGPIDLLLDLAKKQKVNLSNISILKLLPILFLLLLVLYILKISMRANMKEFDKSLENIGSIDILSDSNSG